jgi:hypothetical protein
MSLAGKLSQFGREDPLPDVLDVPTLIRDLLPT